MWCATRTAGRRWSSTAAAPGLLSTRSPGAARSRPGAPARSCSRASIATAPGQGYDLELIGSVAAATGIPVIACSGVGRYEHYAEGIRAGASAVAAANIWHFKELSDRGGKRALAKAGIDIRL